MSQVTNSPLALGAYLSSSKLQRFIPEPKSRLGVSFDAVLNKVGSALGSAGSALSGVPTEYTELLEKQLEMQHQLQVVSMHSNIEKSRHEARMAAVRNVRSA